MRFQKKSKNVRPGWLKLAVVFSAICLLCLLSANGYAEMVYRVEIPFPDQDIPDVSLMDRFSKHAEGYLVKNEETRRVQLGGYLRMEEAESLLGLVDGEYPLAHIVEADEDSNASAIPQHLVFSLKDIGYDRDVIAYGARPYVRIDFPWEPILKLQDANLVLFLRLSPHLRLASSLTVKVGESIVQSRTVLPGEEVVRMQIPLSAVGDYAKRPNLSTSLPVIVEGGFRIYEDYCENAGSVDSWLILENRSRLEISKAGHTPGINSFLSGAYKELLVSAPHDQPQLVGAALQIAAAVKALSPNVKIRHAARPSVSLSGRTVVLGSFAEDIRRQGATLYINPAGAAAFANAAHALLASDRAEIIANMPDVDDQTRHMPFSALNWTTNSVNGLGELVLRVPFSLQQIGGFPESLSATVNFSTTPIPEEDIGQLRIRLNGILAGSLNLGYDMKTKKRSATISLPVAELSQRNQLDIVFVYYLKEGECRGAFPHLEATLFDDSFLMVGPPDTDRYLELNWVFGQMVGLGALVAPELNEATFGALAEWAALYGEINRTSPRFNLHTALPEGGGYDYAVLSIGDAAVPDALSPLVNTTKDILVKNPLTGEIVFQASVGSSFWVMQTFRHKDKPLLLFSTFPPTVRDAEPKLGVQQLERFGGNVAFGADGIWRSMDIGRQLKVVVPDEPGVHYYWARYKALILLFTAGLVLLFLFYVYRNLTTSK